MVRARSLGGAAVSVGGFTLATVVARAKAVFHDFAIPKDVSFFFLVFIPSSPPGPAGGVGGQRHAVPTTGQETDSEDLAIGVRRVVVLGEVGTRSGPK